MRHAEATVQKPITLYSSPLVACQSFRKRRSRLLQLEVLPFCSGTFSTRFYAKIEIE